MVFQLALLHVEGGNSAILISYEEASLPSSVNSATPKSPIKVVFAGTDRRALASLLSQQEITIVAMTPTLQTLLPLLPSSNADVLVLTEPSCDEENCQAVLNAVRLMLPATPIVVVTDGCTAIKDAAVITVKPEHWSAEFLVNITGSTASWRDILRSGALPEVGPQVLPQFQRTTITSSSRFNVHLNRIGSQLVTVFSPKGGVGKTTIAVNLAVAVAELSSLSVALLDIDLESSDIGVHLDFLEGPTITEAINRADQISPENITDFMVRHSGLKLSVMLGPTRPELAELVRLEHVRQILAAMRKRFDLVIVDTPSHPNSDIVYECLEASQIIVMVASGDAACLRQTRIMLDVLEKADGHVNDKIMLVLNQWSGKSRLSLSSLEQFLGMKVSAVIPDDRAAIESAVFEGKPIVQLNKNHAISKVLYDLSTAVCPVTRDLSSSQTPAKSRWLFQKLKKR